MEAIMSRSSSSSDPSLPAAGASRLAAAPATVPDFNPTAFVRGVDNPYFPLTPGTTYFYRGETPDGVETNAFTVTRNTVKILGVTCIEVVDVARLDGEVIEVTRDWFAQDEDGNVWYFGESTQEFENGEVVSTAGTWKAGVDGALPGIIMKADPEAGDLYNQEFAPGVAEDMARVVTDETKANVAYGAFDEVLQTRDFTPLEPGKFEFKFYAEGVGQVLTTSPQTGARIELVSIVIDGTAGHDRLEGREGTDRLIGRAGNDVIFGREGSDTLDGGDGHDRLNGGAGIDRYLGRGGADTFAFSSLRNGEREVDIILDYRRGEGDKIDLPAALASIASERRAGDSWMLTLDGDGDILQLVGLSDLNHNGRISDELAII
jgi:hypothetical protein